MEERNGKWVTKRKSNGEYETRFKEDISIDDVGGWWEYIKVIIYAILVVSAIIGLCYGGLVLLSNLLG